MPSATTALPLIVAAGVCIRKGKLLASLRQEGSHLSGHWEFPGGKLEPGESPEQCVVREFVEELGVEIEVVGIREVVFHRYDNHAVLLLFYECNWLTGTPRPLDVADVKWVDLERLDELKWAPADLDFIGKLKASAT